MSKQVNYNENLCAGAAIRDDKGRRISKLFEASHPKMTVGYAKNLIMPDDPTEQKFNFRKAGGGVIEDGVAVIDKVKGNSVVWNQLMKFGASTKTDNGITYEIKEDGRVHIYGTATARSTVTYYNSIGVIISGHKYIIVSANNIISGEANGRIPAIETQGGITTCNQSDANSVWYFRVQNGVTIDVTFRPQLIDVTQMFGAGNEPSTYEEFLQRKPKVADEYAYNEGTIVNNKMEKVVTTGRNLFDSSTAIGGKTINDTDGAEVKNSLGWCSTFIPIIGGETYFCKGVRIDVQAYGVHYYDKDKQHINGVGIIQNGNTFDAPINAKYIRIHGLYDSSPANTAILNLSDPAFNGQYAPYEKHELDLSWVKDIKDENGLILFPNGIESVGDAYDVVTAARATKKIRAIDLGNVNWSKASYGFYSWDLKNLALGGGNHQTRCLKYPWSSDAVNNPGTCGIRQDGALIVSDTSYSTVKEFTSAMNGVMLYYESLNPIEVSYPEKNMTIPVVAGGTEEAIASEPSSAFRADIGYGIDAVKTILDLKTRVEALEGK